MSLLNVNFGPKLPTEEEVLAEERQNAAGDALGGMLQTQWDNWSNARREIEEEWLKDLRAFNQQNEPNDESLSKFHSHIYFGISRTKALTAYARIVDLMFQSSDKHWDITSTPIPNMDGQDIVIQAYQDEMVKRVELMQTELEDQLVDIKYDDKLKSCILESCILGAGAIKGVIPGVKKEQKWMAGAMGWDVLDVELPTPDISHVSVFDIYPDPYANCVEDMMGCYERHVLNRKQFEALKENPQFNEDAITEILRSTGKGNHVSLYHETERRKIAGINDTTGNSAERYDVLEYWGQVSGSLLVAAGMDDIEDETATYWVNCWTCSGRTLLSKHMPMKKQRIPYNFFIYAKVPHQFWGIGPVRMMRYSQYVMNGAMRSLLDNMAISSGPQVEVDVRMLKAGEDPQKLIPWRVWERGSGDPDTPAVRFTSFDSKIGDFINLADQFRKYADEESGLPSYTHGENIPGLNKTASGTSMLMGAANTSTKAVIVNLEDGCIKPLLRSLYDWNMQWNEREDIKGDMSVDVKGSSALIAKEMQSQRLIQFLQLTNNPVDIMMTDRRYLLSEAAQAMDIDASKAVPDPQEINGQVTGSGLYPPIQPAGMGTPGAIPGAEAQGMPPSDGNLPPGQVAAPTGGM